MFICDELQPKGLEWIPAEGDIQAKLEHDDSCPRPRQDVAGGRSAARLPFKPGSRGSGISPARECSVRTGDLCLLGKPMTEASRGRLYRIYELPILQHLEVDPERATSISEGSCRIGWVAERLIAHHLVALGCRVLSAQP